MDEAGSARRKERPEASGRRSEVDAPEKRAPRDPVTGTPATDDTTARTQPRGQQSAEQLERNIRQTRAEMSATVDAMERQLAPERLKRQAKDTVHETIDEVRDRYHPQRLAQQAGNTMMDTIRDHPVPSLMAGLSIGYLLMKAGEGSSRHERNGYDDRYRRSYAGEGPRAAYYEEDYPYDDVYAAPRSYRGETARGGYYDEPSYPSGDDHSMRDGASEKAGEAQQRTKEMAGQAQERASEWADEAQHRAQAAGRQMRHQARRTQNDLDAFVHSNPLAAGAIAAGVGALIGSMLPSTEIENQRLGPARDHAVRQAKDTAQGTMEQAKEAAGRVADEAKDAAQEVKSTAQQETDRVKSTAQSEAGNVKQEAKSQAQSST